MLSNLLIVAGQVVTLFLMMGVGFLFVKRGWLSQDGLGQMSRLLLYVVAPCIVIDSLLKTRYTPELTRSVGVCFALLAGTYALYMLITHPLYPKQPTDTRNTLRFGAAYANCSFMGLPLIQGVLGSEALIYCTVCMVVFNVATWTHGAALMGGREMVSLKKAVLNPGVIGCIIGFFLFFTGLRPPEPLTQAIDYMADLNTPLAMVVIGGQMASANLAETFRRRSLYAASAFKLVVIPVLTAALLLPLKLEPLMYCTLVILSGCPTAGVTGIFAQQFRQDTSSAAQLITLSTLLSIITLPVLAVIVQALAAG